jgi:hypothetical protein
MKFPVLGILALIISFSAFVFAAASQGLSLLLLTALVSAAVIVVFATLYLYMKPRKEPAVLSVEPASHIPLEDFTVWVDIGSPAEELQSLSWKDAELALATVRADLSSLVTNVRLLNDRIGLLIGRSGFEGLTSAGLSQDLQNLNYGISFILDLVGVPKFSIEGMREIANRAEGCALIAEQIAGKLRAFREGKPNEISVYIRPLLRAVEKLSSDLRAAKSNIDLFIGKAPEVQLQAI